MELLSTPSASRESRIAEQHPSELTCIALSQQISIDSDAEQSYSFVRTSHKQSRRQRYVRRHAACQLPRGQSVEGIYPYMAARIPIVCIAMWVSVAMSLSGQTVTFNTNGLPQDSVKLTTVRDPTFQAELSKIAGAATYPGLDDVLPACFFVRNISGRPILAVTVRYDVVANSGAQFVWEVQREAVSGQAGSFPPGATFLVSPKGWLEDLFTSNSATVRSRILPVVSQIHNRLQAAKEVSVSIDSILYADGLFVGIDRSNSFTHLGDMVRAQKDLVAETVSLLTSGPSESEIMTFLMSQTESAPTSAENRDLYGRRRKLLGELLANRLRFQGRPGLEAEVAKLGSFKIVLRKDR